MSRGALVALVAVACLGFVPGASSQAPTVGLRIHEPEVQPGYTLFSPLQGFTTHLIDEGAHPVHSWTSAYTPGLMNYLLPNGNLLRAGAIAGSARHPNWASAIGGGGLLEEFDWDGNLVWTMNLMDATLFQHHDFKRMPNGNILAIIWIWKSRDEAIQAGRNPAAAASTGFWPDAVYEIQPTPPSGGNIVWEWHVWDHLIQDFDRRVDNYGVVADHPELLNINTPTDDGQMDFNHLNGLDYNADLDQIMLSSRAFNEFWVIDHSTTTAEAASHSGGRYGRGGDILYRWGNPQKYGRGGPAEKKLHNQHDAQWIPAGRPGAGNILVFDNGIRRIDGSNWSAVYEIVPPMNPDGTYDIAPGAAFGPVDPLWTYPPAQDNSFLSPIIAGTQRQPNGNTLICEGTTGTIFEVTPDFRKIWEYVSPVLAARMANQGENLQVMPPIPVQNNAVFKVRKYLADYPGLAGRTLVPDEVLENFEPPPPVPDGSGGTTPMRALKTSPDGTSIRMSWDSVSCPADDYSLYYGDLASVSTHQLAGSLCALGTGGSHDWSGVPPGNVFILMAGIGDYAIYESSYGTDSFGAERRGFRASLECEVTTKSLAITCP